MDDDGFKITFNPAQLAEKEMKEYETELRQAYESLKNPREQLERMQEVIERFGESANKELLSHGIINPFNPEWAWTMEDRKGTKAHKLKQQYKEIAERSDIHLRFDEFYLIMKVLNTETTRVEHMIPAKILLDQSNPLTAYSLLFRQSVRDGIAEIVGVKGRFVFNRTEYTPQDAGIYKASGEVPQEFANILGVLTINRQRTEPAEWARQETELVRKYRQGERVADDFFAKYTGWGSSEYKSTREDKLTHLDHALSPKDSLFESICTD